MKKSSCKSAQRRISVLKKLYAQKPTILSRVLLEKYTWEGDNLFSERDFGG